MKKKYVTLSMILVAWLIISVINVNADPIGIGSGLTSGIDVEKSIIDGLSDNSKAEIGDIITFLILVENTGSTVLDVQVIDEMPNGFEYVTTIEPKNPITFPGSDTSYTELIWEFTGVRSGQKIEIVYKAKITKCGELINRVTAEGIYQEKMEDGDGFDSGDIISVNDEDSVIVDVTCQEPEYTLNVEILGEGQVTKIPDQDTYDEGTQVTLEARPYREWIFEKFTGDINTETNPVTITMDSNKEITATFTRMQQPPEQYKIDITIIGDGQVIITPDQLTYNAGEKVELIAESDEGWYFDYWSGDLEGSNKEETIEMNSDKIIIAKFTRMEQPPVQYTLDLKTEGDGEGQVTKNPKKDTYNAGETVTLTAITETGSIFERYSGDIETETNPITITMDSNKEITATFTQEQHPINPTKYTLDINIQGEGQVIETPEQITYNAGETVELEATPEDGWIFDRYTGENLDTEENPLTITMDSNKEITATFTQEQQPEQYTLDIIIEGNGVVEITPDQDTYDEGTQVTLEAIPDSDYIFDQYTIDLNSYTNPVTITMDSNKEIKAMFTGGVKSTDDEDEEEEEEQEQEEEQTEEETEEEYTLTVEIIGNGTVIKDPDQQTYSVGTEVELTAVADTGWTFKNWSSGSQSSDINPITIIMDSDITITATFVENGSDSFVAENPSNSESPASSFDPTDKQGSNLGDASNSKFEIMDYSLYLIVGGILLFLLILSMLFLRNNKEEKENTYESEYRPLNDDTMCYPNTPRTVNNLINPKEVEVNNQ